MRLPAGSNYILEVLGDQGAGRKFLPAEDIPGKIDIIYPVTEKVVVLHTNDQHFDLNNLETFSEVVQNIRSKYDDVYLFSAGDVFVRHADRWRVNGRLMEDTAWYGERSLQMIHTMNELGYDLMTLGNHELAYIANYTRQALEAARFPLLAANFEIATDKLPQPDAYAILNTSTMRRIAVLGLANDNAKREGIRERDLLETVRNHLSLKDSSDIFLILSHLGLTGDKILAEKFPEPDAIIGGHSHNLLHEPVFVNSVLIAQAGGNLHVVSDDHFTYLGKVVLTLENGKITEKRGRVITLIDDADNEIKNQIELPVRGLCAHRGAMETHPENTLVAFREAVKAGAHMIEFDVHLTKDGEPVVLHDATVDRTTNGTGRVAEMTLSEIKRLDAGSWKSPEFKGERIPTLSEVLREMPVNVWLNVHIKGGGDTPKRVAEILAEDNRLHQAFLACGAEAAAIARMAVPGIMICNMDRKDSHWDYVKGTIDLNAGFIQLNGKITPEFPKYAEELKKEGIRINYYGTDSPDEIMLLFDYGIDFPLVNDIVNSINVAVRAGIEPVKPVNRK